MDFVPDSACSALILPLSCAFSPDCHCRQQVLRSRPVEREAKFSVPDREVFSRLMVVPSLGTFVVGPTEAKAIRDQYVDTADSAFLRAWYACRVRQGAGKSLVSLKSLETPVGALHSRDELEVWIEPQTGLDVSRWPRSPATDLAQRVSQGQPLLVLFELCQERHVRPLYRGDDPAEVIQLSLDHVYYQDGTQADFLEVEAELMPDGDPQDLITLAEILARDWRLMPVVRSKFERALARAFPELIVDLPLGPRRQEGAAM